MRARGVIFLTAVTAALFTHYEGIVSAGNGHARSRGHNRHLVSTHSGEDFSIVPDSDGPGIGKVIDRKGLERSRLEHDAETAARSRQLTIYKEIVAELRNRGELANENGSDKSVVTVNADEATVAIISPGHLGTVVKLPTSDRLIYLKNGFWITKDGSVCVQSTTHGFRVFIIPHPLRLSPFDGIARNGRSRFKLTGDARGIRNFDGVSKSLIVNGENGKKIAFISPLWATRWVYGKRDSFEYEIDNPFPPAGPAFSVISNGNFRIIGFAVSIVHD